MALAFDVAQLPSPPPCLHLSTRIPASTPTSSPRSQTHSRHSDSDAACIDPCAVLISVCFGVCVVCRIQGSHSLHHVLHPKDTGLRDESFAEGGLKSKVIEEAASHGIKGLHHVDKPHEGISEGVKQAYLADHQGGGMQRGQCDCKGQCTCKQCNCKGPCNCK